MNRGYEIPFGAQAQNLPGNSLYLLCHNVECDLCMCHRCWEIIERAWDIHNQEHVFWGGRRAVWYMIDSQDFRNQESSACSLATPRLKLWKLTSRWLSQSGWLKGGTLGLLTISPVLWGSGTFLKHPAKLLLTPPSWFVTLPPVIPTRELDTPSFPPPEPLGCNRLVLNYITHRKDVFLPRVW